MRDPALAATVLDLSDPAAMKSFGKRALDFCRKNATPEQFRQMGDEWYERSAACMKFISFEKYAQNPILRRHLLNTRGMILAEANPHDNIWSIGMAMNNPNRYNRSMWAENRLGTILMALRDDLGKYHSKDYGV